MIKNEKLLYRILAVCILVIVGTGLFIFIKPIEDQQENIISGIATVKYISLEGGFYGLVSDDNKSYNPITLPKEFQIDGLKVKFKARVSKDQESFYMWGTIIEIIDIEKEITAVEDSIIIGQSGGAAMLTAECGNRNYITNTADYIIEGVVENVESRWNEERTSIFTYTNLTIERYVKGTPFETNKLQIVTRGGTVGEITQWVEDQAIFHEGKRVRIYFREVLEEFREFGEQFLIVCGGGGVEEIGKTEYSPTSKTTTVNITTATQTVTTGSQFTVNITLDPSVSIAGAQFDLSFNPALVSANTVTEGDLLSQGGASTYFSSGTINNTDGTITGVASAITTPGQTVSSLGVFATIQMTAKSVEGTSSLGLSNVIVGDINGNPVSIMVNNGSIVLK